jgi:hypothetical protein
MKYVVGLSLAIALGEFVLAVIFPPLVAFFAIIELFGGDIGRGGFGLFRVILAVISMTVGPALLIKWLKD